MEKSINSVGEATTGIWIILRLLPQKRGDTIQNLYNYCLDKPSRSVYNMEKSINSVGEATTGIWIILRLLPQKRGDTIRWPAGYVADKA